VASWERALNGSSDWAVELDSNVKSLVEGSAEGILYGGCLSILVASLGTPYEIRTVGTILFLEDLAAKPFQIDRMLMQLKLAGKLADVEGIIFGEMLDCRQSTDTNKDQGYTLEEVVLRVVGDMGVPVAYGLRSGHVSRRNITLPFGVRAALNVATSGVKLQVLEGATTAAVSSRSAG
jgi:muramoyltetrapeptide carboxypeptidase